MKWPMLLALSWLIASLPQVSSQPATAPQRSTSRFAAVDVFIDSKDKLLAAYQFELSARGAKATLVGIEGGEHPAFAKPPYYDAHANVEHRIVVAAFDVGSDLPRGKTRVARLMVHLEGSAQPHYSAQLRVAASADGKPIPATVSVTEGTAQ